MGKKLNCKAGDFVAVHWDDAVSYPRIEAVPEDVPLARFETFGLVGYVDRDKLVILHEREAERELELSGAPKKKCIEPTCLPTGMIRRVSVFHKRRA